MAGIVSGDQIVLESNGNVKEYTINFQQYEYFCDDQGSNKVFCPLLKQSTKKLSISKIQKLYRTCSNV